jgi:exosome complex component RRP45
MDGKLIIGMNKHREICMIQLVGNILLFKDQVLNFNHFIVLFGDSI